MKRGRSTFEAFQEAKQVRRESFIRDYLEMLAASRVRFKYVTDLSQMVALHIAERESGRCNKSTLLRNKRYKALLLNYMVHRLPGGTKNVEARGISEEKAKALLVTAQLDVANFRREAERLRAHISLLERGATNVKILPPKDQIESDLDGRLHSTHLKYTRTCQALYALLKHMESKGFSFIEDHCMVDKSRMRNNILVDSDIAAPFFEWLGSNRDLGLGYQ
jgi:hypothetical protein